MKYKTATGNSVLRAYNRAAKLASSGRVLSTQQDAGFIMPGTMLKGEGYQVFVKIVRFSKARLDMFPNTGGLLG